MSSLYLHKYHLTIPVHIGNLEELMYGGLGVFKIMTL